MKNTILQNKSYAFAIRIVKLSRYLQTEHKEFILNKQVLRSGTSIGALIREAEFAQSRADFTNKMSIALKEANESDYWLSILKDTSYVKENLCESLRKDCNELIAMLVSTVKATKKQRT